MTNGKRVLIVEDHDSIRDLIRSILTEAGYAVRGVGNGAEALEALTVAVPDLIITDVLMPVKEGIQTIIEIREQHPDLPIVAISGGGRSNNFEPLGLAGRIGANAILHKPFEPQALLKIVQQLAAPAASGAAT